MNGQRCTLTLLSIAVNCWMGCQSIFTARRWCLLLGVVSPILAVSTMPAAGGELEDKLATVCETQDVPGIIAVSVGPDGVIESVVVGVRKRGSDDAIATNDQFALGSNCKSFTATLAAVLVDDDAIDWTTTISEVWPDQPVHDGFKDVTLKQLLAHTGGLQENLPNGAEWISFFAERHKPEQERARMCFLLLTRPPKGTIGKHAYSNLGYVIAAAMLEERGKKPFERLMKDRVFKPLGMTNTEFFSAKKLKRAKGPLLWGHAAGSGDPIQPGALGSENPTVYAGCGTIRTTIGDWAKYIGWHLNESADPVLKHDQTLRRLHEGVVDRGAPGQKYGFGWIHFDSPFGRTLQHTGNNTNQFSLVWVMPDTKRATLAITNTGQAQAFAACDAATATLMKSPVFHQNGAKQTARRIKSKPSKRDKWDKAPPKLSPFTQVRFENEQVIVAYEGKTYQWLELDGIKVEDLVDSSKKQFGDKWQKRISEDLVELLWGMNHRPGKKVKLRLVDLKTKQDFVVKNAPMTKENRSAITGNRQPSHKPAAVKQGKEDMAIDAKLRSRLAGRYQLSPNFIFAVSDRDGQLMVGATNQATLKLNPDSPTRWSCRAVNATLEFELTKTGPAKSLILHQNGNKQTARRIMDDLAIDAKLRLRLVGRYQLTPDFIFDVKDRDGHLMVGITNQAVNEVFPDSPNRWSYRGIDATLEFELKKTGFAKSLVLHQNGASQTARRIK